METRGTCTEQCRYKYQLTCIEQHFDTVQMLPSTGNMQRGPEMAVMRFQIGPNVNKTPNTFRTSLKEMEKGEKSH